MDHLLSHPYNTARRSSNFPVSPVPSHSSAVASLESPSDSAGAWLDIQIDPLALDPAKGHQDGRIELLLDWVPLSSEGDQEDILFDLSWSEDGSIRFLPSANNRLELGTPSVPDAQIATSPPDSEFQSSSITQEARALGTWTSQSYLDFPTPLSARFGSFATGATASHDPDTFRPPDLGRSASAPAILISTVRTGMTGAALAFGDDEPSIKVHRRTLSHGEDKRGSWSSRRGASSRLSSRRGSVDLERRSRMSTLADQEHDRSRQDRRAFSLEPPFEAPSGPSSPSSNWGDPCVSAASASYRFRRSDSVSSEGGRMRVSRAFTSFSDLEEEEGASAETRRSRSLSQGRDLRSDRGADPRLIAWQTSSDALCPPTSGVDHEPHRLSLEQSQTAPAQLDSSPTISAFPLPPVRTPEGIERRDPLDSERAPPTPAQISPPVLGSTSGGDPPATPLAQGFRQTSAGKAAPLSEPGLLRPSPSKHRRSPSDPFVAPASLLSSLNQQKSPPDRDQHHHHREGNTLPDLVPGGLLLPGRVSWGTSGLDEQGMSLSQRPLLPALKTHTEGPLALAPRDTYYHTPPLVPGAHRRHKQQPSVPFSAKSSSAFSSPTSAEHISHSLLPAAPVSNSSDSKRLSRSTTFSGSGSTTSVRSSTSVPNNLALYHDRQHPDISTVFEEDQSVDLHLGQDEEAEQHALSIAQQLATSAPPLLSIRDKDYKTHRPRRSNTTASIHSGQSGKSSRSVHPFANATIRPASPPPAVPALASHYHSVSLSISKSHPELIKMAAVSLPSSHQVLLSSAVKEDEETCPVCVESLSFTFRLPGEKPHIVPECGHSLHEECFVTVYGDVPPVGSRKNIGVCGVCRQPMRISDGGERKKGGGKFAMLTGQGVSSPHAPSASAWNGSVSRSPRPNVDSPAMLSGPHSDDPVEPHSPLPSSPRLRSAPHPNVIVPSITIRSEHSSISRQSRKGKPTLTAMVTVTVPSASNRPMYPARPRQDESLRGLGIDPMSPALPPSPRSDTYPDNMTSSSSRSTPLQTPDSFAHVVADLRNRMNDYKSSGLEQLGSLRLFDLLHVRKGNLVREFHVYLFQEALICVSEEKRSGLKAIFSSASSAKSDTSGMSGSHRGVLKLKGRIYVRHVNRIADTSTRGELSLTIAMDDEAMDPFVLTFKDRASHETWRSSLTRLLDETKNDFRGAQIASKVAKIMGADAPAPRSASGSTVFTPTTMGSARSNHSRTFADLVSPPIDGLPSATSSAFATSPRMQDGAGSSKATIPPLAPVHTPIDLVIVLSLPATSPASPEPLKVKLMRNALDFVLALMGPKDRVALVASELGASGSVRRTPFLNATLHGSRKRLQGFAETIGAVQLDDEFLLETAQDERQDVVSAVNVALDVILQRKQKNPLSGMILISDTAETVKRAQMDLVTARLDAANVPVHSLGYGKTHDPSPLWMISNHTHGSYTFVKEWYDLRDTLAGVVGGLMSIAMTNMKLHLSSQEHNFSVSKVTGPGQALVASHGKTVELDLRELRHGESREILIDLEYEVMDNQRGSTSDSDERGSSGAPSHTVSKQSSFNLENGMRGMGLDNMSDSGSSRRRDGMFDSGVIDEVPVIEVDCSFNDPAAGRSVARLAHPVLLTVAILPSSAPLPSSPANPGVVMRKMQLLSSDMITRSLLLASRKNFGQATRMLKETNRIVETVTDNMRQQAQKQASGGRSAREMAIQGAIEGLSAALLDVDALLEGLEEHPEIFERDQRNWGAQQASVLKAQRSWTTRTPSERMYATEECQQIIRMSSEWGGRS